MPTTDPTTSEWLVRSVFIRPPAYTRRRAFDRVFGNGEFAKRTTTAAGGLRKGASEIIMTVAEAAQLKVAGVDVDDTKIPKQLVDEYWDEVDRLNREKHPPVEPRFAAPLDQVGVVDDGRLLAMEFKISALEDEVRQHYERRLADKDAEIERLRAAIRTLRRSLHVLTEEPDEV